jgi:hypothetical protein
MTEQALTEQAFLSLLADMLVKTIPTDASESETARQTGLSITRKLLEAWQPADAMEAALAARAIAAWLAAMDSFARAAKPGLSDEKAIRLRGNAIAAGRVFDNLLRTFRRQRQPVRAKPQPRVPDPAPRARKRIEPPLPIPGLSDALIEATRRAALHGGTALTFPQPTVLVPG